MEKFGADKTINDQFEDCFKTVLEGLLEFHPSLRMANVVASLKAKIESGWSPTGNAQNDYVALRDLVEAKLPGIVERLAQQVYSVSIRVEVLDESALYHAALGRLKKNGMSHTEADAVLMTDDVINAQACLNQVFSVDEANFGVKMASIDAAFIEPD